MESEGDPTYLSMLVSEWPQRLQLVVDGRVLWLGREKRQMAAGGVLRSKRQITFGTNICLCNHEPPRPGVVNKEKILQVGLLIIVVTINQCNQYFLLQPCSVLIICADRICALCDGGS